MPRYLHLYADRTIGYYDGEVEQEDLTDDSLTIIRLEDGQPPMIFDGFDATRAAQWKPVDALVLKQTIHGYPFRWFDDPELDDYTGGK
jgi:hypothetical protein